MNNQKKKNRRGSAFAPIQRRLEIKNERALKALQENIDNAKSPNRKYIGNTGKKNSYIDSYRNETAGVETQITNTPNARRGRERDVAFQDMEGDGFNQRSSKGTKADRQLRSAVVRDQIARGLGELNSGDKVTSNPTTKSRARLYKGIGGEAFDAVEDKKGNIKTEARITRDGGAINAKGKKTKGIDLKELKGPLARLGIKNVMRLVGGPVAQGLMTIDDGMRRLSPDGDGFFEHRAKGQEKTIKMGQQTIDAIKKRLGLK